ncbi:MAG: M48 family metallopeptidase [Deltaproteobacteria bacterium]|jgi:STE24 endopeptidase|nr:M48 family metallopeptidase [Deltaproteobacteria bacterium]
MFNLYFWIILGTLMLSQILELISVGLNLKNLSPELPEEFSGYYDETKYAKSQNYLKTTTKFAVIKSQFNFLVLLVFWFSGGFNLADNFARSLELNSILTGLVFFGLLGTGSFLLNLPFSIYSTFVIEEKFGFNRTTPQTFILDLFKHLFLSLVLGIPVLSALFYFFGNAGESGWLLAWAAIALFTVIIQALAPALIMPLFYKFQPVQDGELKDKINHFADKIDFPLQGVYVIDGSRRSSKSNAFFTGFGKNKRIALFDTLIEEHTPEEIIAVLAHEIGHYKKKHIIKSMLISLLHTGVMFYLLSLFLLNAELFAAFGMEHLSVYASFIFFGMLYSPISLFLSIFEKYFSRKNEYQADNFAVENIPDGKNLISGLKKLAVNNLSNLTPHPFHVFLNYSHPPLLKRIKAIKNH